VRLWTAPFIVALIGEYISQILDDIDEACSPKVAGQLATFIRANPGYWATTKRRVQSYYNCNHACVRRGDYAGFRLIEKLEMELSSRSEWT
jgi:hypothetical protein